MSQNDIDGRTKRLLSDREATNESSGMRKKSTPTLERMRDALATGAVIVTAVAIIGGLGVGGYQIKRWANWNLSYQDDVRQEICREVKPEYLQPEYAASCRR